MTGLYSQFQQAAARLDAVSSAKSSPIIVCNEDHRFLASEQLREIDIKSPRLVLEPKGLNTAPSVTLAALAASAKGEDPVLVISPADQNIDDSEAFHLAIQKAIHSAKKGNIALLGVPPTKPETGYGYIKADGETVVRFVEKPDEATAIAYLEEGGYFWNAGIFVLKASVWLKALHLFNPHMLATVRGSWDARSIDNLFIRPGKEIFNEVTGESVDYAVLEHCPGSEFTVEVFPLDAGWNDLGSWAAVWETLPKDDDGNAFLGDVIITNSKDTLVHSTNRLVALVGVDDIVVVETPDAVLVARKSSSQDVKKVVDDLIRHEREERLTHRKVLRPWGWYDSVDEGGRFKVKRIQVNPGATLSLQKHYHRAEHWVVVRGTAEVTCGTNVTVLTENQSTFIPLGEVHRLSNPGTIPLEIIEVQSGSYLGEDDIVRFEDKYGRKD
jgi:mannose-1-phosphate guanylyltransferase/mannose-6-phosphate isomerase